MELPEPPPHYPVFQEWLDTTLRLLEPQFEEWEDDLDKIHPSGFTGLQLHATPIAEARLPLHRRRATTLWLKKEFLFRPSTYHLKALDSLAEESRELVDYLARLNAMDVSDWKKLHASFDALLQWRIHAAVSGFNEAVDSYHERHAPPTPFELRQLKRVYLEIWATGALWVKGRDHLIRLLISKNHWWGEREQKHVQELEAVGFCRTALIRFANPKYRW